MKLLGLHWTWHLLYLAALAGLVFFGKNRLGETAFLKNKLGEVQQLTLKEMPRFRQASLNQIDVAAYSYPTPENERMHLSVRQALALVRAFGEKCDMANKRLRGGTRANQINWRADLLDDFYRLGDSLSIVYGADSARQAWLERCLFLPYHAFPPDQLAAMFAASDTADAGRLCRNLHLEAELALLMALEILRKKIPTYETRFDGLMPVLVPRECPRAGVPFKADIFLASYSRSAKNLGMKVNGKPLPVEAGVGRYETVFKRPGPHKLRVEIREPYPFNEGAKIWHKEFVARVSAAQK